MLHAHASLLTLRKPLTVALLACGSVRRPSYTMRMYPVRGRGEACLRPKTVHLRVPRLGGGGTGDWCASAGARARQANCPWHARTEASVRRGDCSKPDMQIALEAGRRLGDHKDRPYPDTPPLRPAPSTTITRCWQGAPGTSVRLSMS